MTLATGRAALGAARHRPPRDAGFTLVEIIVVMAIIVTLFALVAVGVGGLRGRASEKATRALVDRLKAYLQDYKSKTGTYPPDGIDSVVKNDEGTPIKGSACLYYFLAKRNIRVRDIRAGKEIFSEEPPLATFSGGELSSENPDYPGAREILDGWQNPIHYDNTEDGAFKPQRGEVHLPPIEDDSHPQDPRDGTYEVGTENAVREAGVQSNGYDLWSYGEQQHEVKPLKAKPIASWNIQE